MAYLPVQNQSVSGTVGASVIGLTPVSVSNFPLASGSVVAFQGTDPWIITGSVQGSFSPAANQSVSGTVGASVIGLTPVAVTNTPSISGTVLVGNLPTTQNVSGSVVAFQGTSPWVVAPNNSSVITISSGSVGAVIIGGSIAASFTPPDNQSVSGTVNVGNFPTTQNVSGSVVSFQGTTPWAVTNVGSIISLNIGSVITVDKGSSILAVPVGSTITVAQGSIAVAIISGSVAVATGNSSVMLLNSTNVIGSVLALQGTNPWITTPIGSNIAVLQSSSLIARVTGSVVTLGVAGSIMQVMGSVAATQGTTPWLIGSVYGNVSGSVVSFQGGTWKPSVMSIEDTGTVLLGINREYSSVTTVGSTADIITTGYRTVDFLFTLDSTGTPTDITFIPQAKSGVGYYKMKNGFLGNFIFDDQAVAVAQNIHVKFPAPASGAMRILVSVVGTSSAATFTVSSAITYLST